MPDWLIRAYYRYQSHIVVISAAAMLLGYALFSNPDADFQSDDGDWADGEVLFKGRDFESVVWYFEYYKLACDVPEAALVRTTPRNWVNVFAWPSYIGNQKWRVPYREGDAAIGGHYPPASDMTHCYNKPRSGRILKRAELNARRFLERL